VAALRGAHLLVATDQTGRTASVRVEEGDNELTLFERLGHMMTALGVEETDTVGMPLADSARLNPTQLAVVQDTRARAAHRSHAAMPKLLQRLSTLGLDAAACERMLDYMKRAPITVNFNPDKSLQPTHANASTLAVDRSLFTIDAYLADGFYRNQFETQITSGASTGYWGGSRDQWERTIFMGGYHAHPLVPQERPKYGASNATGLVAGPAGQYGSCYFVMKESARERTTLTPRNSSGCTAEQVGTSDACAHLLSELSADELKRINEMSQGGALRDQRIWTYIEAQIHGPISFAEDIAEIVIHTKFKTTPYEAKLRELAARSGATIKWHDGKVVIADVTP
jgi:hypothetical protein